MWRIKSWYPEGPARSVTGSEFETTDAVFTAQQLREHTGGLLVTSTDHSHSVSLGARRRSGQTFTHARISCEDAFDHQASW